MRAKPLTKAILLGTALVLTGCGVTYVSPTVSTATEGVEVRVLPITRETVLLANRAPYAPRSLPAYFRQTAGGGELRGAGALPPAPVLPELQPRRPELRMPPQGEAGLYRLGVGDVIRLATRAASVTPDAVSGEVAGQNIRQDYTLRDDGSVAIPEVGAVAVEGLTIEEAEARLFQRFIEAGIDPTFSLEVGGFNSRRITVGGAVGSATVIPVGLTLPTLDEALTAGGGIQVATPEFGVIQIYRDGTLYSIPTQDYTGRGDLRGLRLMPGDQVFVDQTYDLDRALTYYQRQIDLSGLRRSDRSAAIAELQSEIGLRRSALDEQRSLFQARTDLGAEARDYVYLAGEVSEQGRFTLPYEQQATLADVIYGSGGFPVTTGNPSQIYVLRAATDPAAFGAVTAWHLDASNAINLTVATQMQMRPDDIVFIEEQPITRWNRALQQFFPVLINSAANAVN